MLTYLNKNWERFELHLSGDPKQLSSLILTPGFKASSHLIVLIFQKDSPRPFLVVKLPRIPGDNIRLDREAVNLRQIQTVKQGGFKSIPTVISHEDYKNYRLLVETAVPGQVMRPAIVRQNPVLCTQSVLSWLLEVQSISSISCKNYENWFRNLAENRMHQIPNSFQLIPEEEGIFAKANEIVEILKESNIPLVFEHGDLSSPNILVNDAGQVGVVDWELAEPVGLPLADLIFVLTYISFAKFRATKIRKQLPVFHDSFFKSDGWTLPYIMKYCETLNIEPQLIKPLFVLFWSRYLANIIFRLKGDNAQLSNKSVEWLRTNRYFLIWKHTVKNIEQFFV